MPSREHNEVGGECEADRHTGRHEALFYHLRAPSISMTMAPYLPASTDLLASGMQTLGQGQCRYSTLAYRKGEVLGCKEMAGTWSCRGPARVLTCASSSTTEPRLAQHAVRTPQQHAVTHGLAGGTTAQLTPCSLSRVFSFIHSFIIRLTSLTSPSPYLSFNAYLL